MTDATPACTSFGLIRAGGVWTPAGYVDSFVTAPTISGGQYDVVNTNEATKSIFSLLPNGRLVTTVGSATFVAVIDPTQSSFAYTLFAVDAVDTADYIPLTCSVTTDSKLSCSGLGYGHMNNCAQQTIALSQAHATTCCCLDLILSVVYETNCGTTPAAPTTPCVPICANPTQVLQNSDFAEGDAPWAYTKASRSSEDGHTNTQIGSGSKRDISARASAAGVAVIKIPAGSPARDGGQIIQSVKAASLCSSREYTAKVYFNPITVPPGVSCSFNLILSIGFVPLDSVTTVVATSGPSSDNYKLLSKTFPAPTTDFDIGVFSVCNSPLDSDLEILVDDFTLEIVPVANSCPVTPGTSSSSISTTQSGSSSSSVTASTATTTTSSSSVTTTNSSISSATTSSSGSIGSSSSSSSSSAGLSSISSSSSLAMSSVSGSIIHIASTGAGVHFGTGTGTHWSAASTRHLTTSTVYATYISTAGCPQTVTDCPAESKILVTKTVALYSTVYPVTYPSVTWTPINPLPLQSTSPAPTFNQQSQYGSSKTVGAVVPSVTAYSGLNPSQGASGTASSSPASSVSTPYSISSAGQSLQSLSKVLVTAFGVLLGVFI